MSYVRAPRTHGLALLPCLLFGASCGHAATQSQGATQDAASSEDPSSAADASLPSDRPGEDASIGQTDAAIGRPPPGRLLWSDEFEVDGRPDASKWNFETQAPGWVNDELQAYTGDRSENVRVEGGLLVIEARRDHFGGHEYSSARLHSAGKGDFLHTRVEVRAKLPAGRGTWPAIWMMPTNVFRHATTCSAETGWIENCDAWPNSGEIDIMEYVGHDPGVVHASIHCAAYNHPSGTQKTASTQVEAPSDTFHTYAVERRPGRIEVFVDDTRFFVFEDDKGGWQTWPFEEPFHVILNVAVGGIWGGQMGVDSSVFPQKLQIEYVRVYELAD
jgi:beta-glucanase (GH16 family)